MSLRAFLQNLININIRTKTPKVIKTEHADVEDKLLAEIYPLKTIDSNIIELYTSKQSNQRPYWFTIYKQGTTVFIRGWFRQTSGTLIPPSKVFSFRDLIGSDVNEFLPDDSSIDTNTGLTEEFVFWAETPQGTKVWCSIGNRAGAFNGNGLYVNGSNFLPNTTSDSRYMFNTSYTCKA